MPSVRHACLWAAILAAATTGACRQEERGRPTSFTPGVYKGETMPTLTAEQVKQLETRGALLR